MSTTFNDKQEFDEDGEPLRKYNLWGRIYDIKRVRKVQPKGRYGEISVLNFTVEIRREDKDTGKWNTSRYAVTAWAELADKWGKEGRLKEGAVVSIFGKLILKTKEGYPCLAMTAYKIAVDLDDVYIPKTAGMGYYGDWDEFDDDPFF